MITNNRRHASAASKPPRTGDKGERTKLAFILGLQHELERYPWRSVTIVSVARHVGRSPAAASQYWEPIDEMFADLCAWTREQGAKPSTHLMMIENLLTFEASRETPGD